MIASGTGKTPYELWAYRDLNLRKMVIWGTECWVHLPKEKDKSNPRSVKGIFVGHTDPFYRDDVYLPDEQNIVRASNPRFVVKDIKSREKQSQL